MIADFGVGDSVLDRYRVFEMKSGGMGVVFMCLDEGTGRFVALKTIQREYLRDEKRKNQFVGELETWIRLGKHPHIVQAYHIEEANGLPYVVMEMVPPVSISTTGHIGPSLQDQLQYFNRSGGRFDCERLLRLGLHICTGMQYAKKRFNELGLLFVHLDIKPANILVTPDDIAKVTDFGIAKVELDTPASGWTFAYASPEQLKGGACDIRSDVYSFGLTLYEMLTGRQYYRRTGNNTREPQSRDWRSTAKKVTGTTDVPVADDLICVLERCLEENREKRFSDFGEIHTGLSSIYRGFTGREHVRAEGAGVKLSEAINRGYSFNYLGLYGEALSIFERVLAADQDYPQLWLNLGISQYGLGRMKDAEESFRHALKLDPGYSRAWFNLGNIQRERGDTEASAESYRLANKHSDGLKEAYLNLGLAHREAARIDEAVDCFESALRLDPHWPPAWYELGHALYESGEVLQAVQSLQIAVIYDPEAVEAMMLLSRIYRERGDEKNAEKWRERARASDPNQPGFKNGGEGNT